jgi:hypothetical protein
MNGDVKRSSKMITQPGIQGTKQSVASRGSRRSVPKTSEVKPRKDIPHSAYSAARSASYAKEVDRMNPSKVLPARRLFPGLAN